MLHVAAGAVARAEARRVGAVGLLIIVVIPFIFNGVFHASVSFGGTSIIIIVGVILETLKQIESSIPEYYYSHKKSIFG